MINEKIRFEIVIFEFRISNAPMIYGIIAFLYQTKQTKQKDKSRCHWLKE
jgi:hypothetical protein